MTKGVQNSFDLSIVGEAEVARIAKRQALMVKGLASKLSDFGITQATRVLEIGSGCGLASIELARQFEQAEIVGLDLQEQFLAHARAELVAAADVRARTQFLQGDVRDLSRFAGHSFDLIYACYVLQHVQHLDRAFTELRRVLRPGGWLVVDTMSRDNTWFFPEEPRHLRLWTRGVSEGQARWGGHPRMADILQPTWTEHGFQWGRRRSYRFTLQGTSARTACDGLLPTLGSWLSESESWLNEALIADLDELLSRYGEEFELLQILDVIATQPANP